MKIAYADCFSGISGDMFLGALLHAGLDINHLQTPLKTLDIGSFELQCSDHADHSIEAYSVKVETQPCSLRHLPSIIKIIKSGSLPDSVMEKSIAVFDTIAIAEAKVHGIAKEKVHFHEIGAIDTIVDVVGTVLGLYLLGIEKLACSPLPMGRGFVNCDHGRLPLPGPAVCEILQDFPVYGINIEKELVTPTGAALLKTLATDYGPMPSMTISATGYGAGTHTLPDRPNLFRLFIGESREVDEAQEVEIIETHLDDWSPETFPYICDLLLSKGALDVSISAIHMKKGRPGFRLQVISPPSHGVLLKQTILSETTAIGLRFRRESRYTLPRDSIEVSTPWGKIQAKKVQTPKGVIIYPEYEECCKIAKEFGVPIQRVYKAVEKSSV